MYFKDRFCCWKPFQQQYQFSTVVGQYTSSHMADILVQFYCICILYYVSSKDILLLCNYLWIEAYGCISELVSLMDLSSESACTFENHWSSFSPFYPGPLCQETCSYRRTTTAMSPLVTWASKPDSELVTKRASKLQQSCQEIPHQLLSAFQAMVSIYMP